MTINERIKFIRKDKGLSQSEFGGALGLTNFAISKIEKGFATVTKQNILSLVREYGVNKEWLITGNGKPYTDTIDDEIKALAERHNLDELQTSAIRIFLGLKEEHRKAFSVFFDKMIRLNSGETTAEFSEELTPQLPAAPLTLTNSTVGAVHNVGTVTLTVAQKE